MAAIQRNFVNQNPDGKFGRLLISSIDPDLVKLILKKEHSHDKTFEVHVDGGDLVVHGDLSCNGTIYDGSGNDLAARVDANTIAIANAINQVDLNATNIAANVGFINQNIGAIAENTLSASNNATLINALGIVQGTQATAIGANAGQAEDNRMDILGNAANITAHDASLNSLNGRFSSDLVEIMTDSNGKYAEMLVATGATDTNDMQLYIRPEPNTGTQKLKIFLDDNTRFGGKINVADRIILKENGFWGQMLVGTGHPSISRLYISPQDTNKPLYVIIDGETEVDGYLSVNGNFENAAFKSFTVTNNTLFLMLQQPSGASFKITSYQASGNGQNNVAVHASSFNSSSDDRKKAEETPIMNATETIKKLKPQVYKKYGNFDLSGDYVIESGLIAQEIYYNAPELRHLVDTGNDASGNPVIPSEMDLSNVNIGKDPDYEAHGWTDEAGLNYDGLIAYLIKSNQELNERIVSLKTENAELKGQIIQATTDITMIRNHIGMNE